MSGKSYLEEVSIRSLGVIDNSTLDFGPGLNVLTGETGAGKTMVLTAISLVLGGRSDSHFVRQGAGRCVVSANFRTSDFEVGEEYLEDGSLLLTRSVSEDGKSKASAGGIAVAASLLAEFGEELIQIHGQAANISIVKPSKQRELLDSYAGAPVKQALGNYVEIYDQYLSLRERLKAMKAKAAGREAEIGELEEFLAAGNRVKPRAGELEEIEGELSRLSSVEALHNAAASAMKLLDDEESGSYSTLSQAKRALETVTGKDPALDAIGTNLNEAFYLLGEVTSDLGGYLSSLQADPARLDYLHQRKSEISAFMKRFGKSQTLAEIIDRLKIARATISDLKGGDDRIAELESELREIKRDLLTAAKRLSDARSKAAESLSREVSEEIHQLSMPHTNFRVNVSSPDYQGTLKESDFTVLGCDEVSMEIQSHQGAPYLSISKSASGGEMSRIMLALEVVIAKTHPVGTYIFDEVDAGVGGKAAIEVGRRLATLSKSAQVIVVTHLPQVAAWADTHFSVTKSSDGSIVSSGVRKLTTEERIEEIARMLAGLGESSSAREHAAELLALRS